MSSKIINDTLYIEEIIVPNLIEYADKLSVHKNHSTSIKVYIPFNLSVFMNVENGLSKISGDFTDFKIFQSSGKIVFHNWGTPGSIKTLSADVLFNNPRIKILSSSNINLECLNFDSKKIINVQSVTGEINCLIY